MKHVLFDALSVILPNSDDTLLLRACLDPGESGRQACESWLARRGDVTIRGGCALPARRNDGHGATPDLRKGRVAGELARESVKALLPLMWRAVYAHSVRVSNPLLTILKTAAVREELRTRTYRLIARRVLATMAAKEFRTIPIKGVVLGETVYPNPALRHSHDIEILVEDGDLDAVARLLIGLEFTLSRARSGSGLVEFIHGSGLPLVLHRELFEIPFYNAGLQEIRSRTRTAVILDAPVRILSPADSLFHTCGHAAYSVRRDSCRWVADAWFTIDRHRDLDWDSLLNAASRAHLALPLSVMLSYLAEQLNAPVPMEVLDRAAAVASRTRPIGRDLALYGARAAARAGFGRLISEARSWRGRLHVIRWMLAPSPDYLRWVSGLRHRWLLPAQYVYRPIRYLSRRVRRVRSGNRRRAGQKRIAPATRCTTTTQSLRLSEPSIPLRRLL